MYLNFRFKFHNPIHREPLTGSVCGRAFLNLCNLVTLGHGSLSGRKMPPDPHFSTRTPLCTAQLSNTAPSGGTSL